METNTKNPGSSQLNGSSQRRTTNGLPSGLEQGELSRTDNSNNNNEPISGARLIQTLTACTRCRKRKTKCDVGLPKCGPCQRARPPVDCKFLDSERGQIISRSYVVTLQEKVRALEAEYRRRTAKRRTSIPPSIEDLVRSVGMVSLADEEPEPHNLGPSAGLSIARLVLNFARERTVNNTVEDIVPSNQHEPAKEQGKEQTPNFPALSAQPFVGLPDRRLADKLITEFIFKRAQFQLPTLHEPCFLTMVDEVYAKSQDPHKQFTVKLVLAIAMQKVSIDYYGLADSLYTAALQHLEAVIAPMDLNTLQSFCLLGQYSLLTPTRTGIYHIIGLATRLCIDLGLDNEETIKQDPKTKIPYDPLTVDMRRRLFWITVSMESGLSHILGRPSGFAGNTFAGIQFFQPVDDIFITKDRIMPGPPSVKKLMSMHFFRMRTIQAEIRRTLYQNPLDTPKSDKDPWFSQMYAKLDAWVNHVPPKDEKVGVNMGREWFEHRYNNMLIFLYRPSPQIPEPSIEATILCYNCAVTNIALQKKMFDNKTSDMTWVLVHQVYMTCIIMMWSLSCKRVRELHPREEVAGHIQTGLDCMDMLVERWPGVKSAREIFFNLSRVALQSYDQDMQTSSQPEPRIDLNSFPMGPITEAYVSPPVLAASQPSHDSPSSDYFHSSPPLTPSRQSAQSPLDFQSPNISNMGVPSPFTSPNSMSIPYSPQYPETSLPQSSPGTVMSSESFTSFQPSSDPTYAMNQGYQNTYMNTTNPAAARHHSVPQYNNLIRHISSPPTLGNNIFTSQPGSLNTIAYTMPPTNNIPIQRSTSHASAIMTGQPLKRDPSSQHHHHITGPPMPMSMTSSAPSRAINATSTAAPVPFTQQQQQNNNNNNSLFTSFPNPYYAFTQQGYNNHNMFPNGFHDLMNYQNQVPTMISPMYNNNNVDLLQQDQVDHLMETLETESHQGFVNIAQPNPFSVFY